MITIEKWNDDFNITIHKDDYKKMLESKIAMLSFITVLEAFNDKIKNKDISKGEVIKQEVFFFDDKFMAIDF